MKQTKPILLLLLALVLAVMPATAADKVLKVLAIGNSFSADAVEQNVVELAAADGRQMIVANMFIGGCPLSRHVDNARQDKGAYRYRKTGVDGKRVQQDNMSISRALADEQWDYVSLQQASDRSGQPETYEPYLTELIEYIKKLSPKSEIVWHQTWAYAKSSRHGAFPRYGNDQLRMYNCIVDAAQKAVKSHGIDIVIPVGTAIQNARTTFIGDNMNRDGHHLENSYGRYTAACTWYEALTGRSVVGNAYRPEGLNGDLARAAQEAAHAAVGSPWTVTNLAYIQPSTVLYKDKSVPVAVRVEDLLHRMTMHEKVMQMVQYTLGTNNIENNKGVEVKNIPAETGSLIYFGTEPTLRNNMQRHAMEDSRLGIPILFGYDAIHGFRTIFPIPLAQACSFNPHLTRLSCRVSAQEARMSGVDWTFSPMIDVAHDPRWGRVAEGYGEDPYLNGVFGAAAVRGYQGKNLADSVSIAACLKHYVAYGASEAGRDYVYTEVSRQTLWDTYLPPYRKALEANPATVMSSFNNFSGTPVTASKYLLTDVLKKQLGFGGFIVSDWAAIEQLKAQGAARDLKRAGELAANAGLDMDMMSHSYDKHLEQLVAEGRVDTAVIDDAVRRILKVKFDLGLFENPYTPAVKDDSRFLRKESVKLAEELAEESMVLLKNDNNTLPLRTQKRILLTGPLADAPFDMLGCWYGHGETGDITSILTAMKTEFEGKADVQYVPGCPFEGDDESGFRDAVKAAKKADVIVVCLGEKGKWSGENASRASIELPSVQLRFLEELKKAGKPVVVVLSNGRPLQLDRVAPLADAMVEMWQPGIVGGTPLAGILSGRVNPSGRLAMTFPVTGGQIPIYYNRRPSARHHQGFYHDLTSDPLYEFGYGLSYTTFEYGEPVVSRTTLDKKGRFSVEVEVRNTGAVDGKETVLGFVTCPYAELTRPVKELRFFTKKEIKAGETVKCRFDLNVQRDLGFVNDKGETVVEPGEYRITIGGKTVTLEITE